MFVRWMIRRDMPECLAMPNGWDEREIIRALLKKNTIGMVCEVEGQVWGYMIYTLYKTRLELNVLVVDPLVQRRGVGTGLMTKMFGKLSPHRRTQILMSVPDDQLGSHLFLKQCGFKCYEVKDDLYLFSYDLGVPVECV